MSKDFTYDELPYPSKFFVQTHPDRLAVHATLFGMLPPPPAACRVLELGCGNGSNLIAQAYLTPGSQFIGIDLAKRHIDEAREAAKELGLKNIEFRHMNVMDVTEAEFGPFDYITAHGLFSWVPAMVRERVLKLYRELLVENGVGYISYSVFPGAHIRQMAQQAMRFHITEPEIADAAPGEKVGKAMSFLKFLAENTLERGAYRTALEHELKRHFTHSAADIFHDDLSEINQSFYFYEFAELLESSGLQFLAEAELHAMGTQGLAGEVRRFLDSLDDVIRREQYIDLFRGRVFRQTLVCPIEASLKRNPEPSVIDNFMLASTLRPSKGRVDLSAVKIEKFTGFGNTAIEIDQPLVKAILFYMGSVWGRAVPFHELLEEGWRLVRESGYREDDVKRQEDIARTVLLQIANATNAVEMHVYQPSLPSSNGERPRISDLARWQLKSSDHILTLLGIDMSIEDQISRRLLELLDGTRDKAEVLDRLKEFAKASEEIKGKAELPNDLAKWLDESLMELARIGVFSA